MHFSIITIFPDIFEGFLTASLIGKAVEKGIIEIDRIDLRTFGPPPHRNLDDIPYGGGAGMVLAPEPLVRAIEQTRVLRPDAHTIYFSPAGPPLTQARAVELSKMKELLLVCGRYEGIDQRVVDRYVHEEISIGDYVTMGGEVPAMVLLETVIRLIPGVVGNAESIVHESFSPMSGGDTRIEAPHYTRPENFRGDRVPEVLLSGNHAKIDAWRLEQSQLRTERRRGKNE